MWFITTNSILLVDVAATINGMCLAIAQSKDISLLVKSVGAKTNQEPLVHMGESNTVSCIPAS